MEGLEPRIVLSLSNSLSDWMSFVPDSTKLVDMSIPGSHDAATGEYSFTTVFDKTQDYKIDKQLALGIRYLDIRTRHNGDLLPLHHGTTYLGTDFSTVLISTTRFLTDHPGETILMRLKGNENGAATKTTRSYRETLKAYFDAPDFAGHRYLDFLWLAGGKNAGDITLGEVRGKIVLFEDSWELSDGTGGTAPAYYNRPNPFLDAYGLPTEISPRENSNKRAQDPDPTGKQIQTPADRLAAAIKHLRDDVDPRAAGANTFYYTSLVGNNYRFPDYFSPVSYAVVTNKGMSQYLAANPPSRSTGIISIDFVGVDLSGNNFDDSRLPGQIVDFNERLISDPRLKLTEVGVSFGTSQPLPGIPFAKDVISGIPAHSIAHLNDGIFGNPNSWLGSGQGSAAGINLGGLRIVDSVAFGRDNTKVYNDRVLGVIYKVQFTTVDQPSELDWKTIGVVEYSANDPQAALRHRYSFNPVLARSVRIKLSDQPGALGAIDELQVYGTEAPAPLKLIETGQGFGAGNLALNGIAFAKNVYYGTDFVNNVFAVNNSHTIAHLNDGIYGNANSWLGNSQGSYVGISLGLTPVTVSSVAWGRDNTGKLQDRSNAVYVVQYTGVPFPSQNTPDSAWITIGIATNPSNPALRHRYAFNPVSATGIRILILDSVANPVVIDELEVYATANTSKPALALTETGGAFSTDNLALQGVAFAKDVVSNNSSHTIAHLNDGVYGNSNSWLGNTTGSFAGINLGGEKIVAGVAFGRDNTGNFKDRSLGQYTIQYTQTPFPSQFTPDSEWKPIGSLNYTATNLGTPALRHRYDFDPVFATGMRILIGGDAADRVAIDELEVFAFPSSNVGIKGVEEGPSISEAQEFNIAENSASGTVVGTVAATHTDSSRKLKFSLSSNPGGAFAINETTGEITVASGATLDFETTTQFMVGVTVTEEAAADDSGFGFGQLPGDPLSAMQNVTIHVIDVNEPPTLTITGVPVTFKANLKQAIAVLPQTSVGDSDGLAKLGGGTLEVTLNVISTGTGKKLKLLDVLNPGDIIPLGFSVGPQVANGLLKLQIELNQDVTTEAIQRFLQGITFKTSGKGLSTPTRTLTVTLTDTGGLPVTVQQTINVAKK